MSAVASGYTMMTCAELARSLGVSRSTARRRLVEAGIQITSERRKRRSLTNKEKGLLVGMALGDSSFAAGRPNDTPRLVLSHSATQEEYLDHKASLLIEILGPTRKYRRSRLDARTGKTYHEVSIGTRSHSFLTELRDMMRPGVSGKQATDEALSLLTVEGLAIWYCDDGSLYQGDVRHLNIATQSYNNKAGVIGRIRELTGVTFKTTSQGSIRITNKADIVRFLAVVSPFIHTSMNYKKCVN